MEFDEEFDELAAVPTDIIKRQIEIGESLLKEYTKIGKSLSKMNEGIFAYAPEVLDWLTGDVMACVTGEVGEAVADLKTWLVGMRKTMKLRNRGK